MKFKKKRKNNEIDKMVFQKEDQMYPNKEIGIKL
jgi:hypothetical protein